MEYKAAKDIVNVGDYEGILRCSVQPVTLEDKEKKTSLSDLSRLVTKK